MDIHIVIGKSVVYSLLIAWITATHLVAIMVAEKWFQGFLGYQGLLSTVVVAFVIAIFFNPVRSRLQAFVDRALFKATPEELATQREQLLNELQKSDQTKAIATLATGLAHEIKNPLAAIKTFTESLRIQYDDPGFRERFERIVGGEVERINAITQRLLEFAKPVPPDMQPLRMTEVIDQTLEFLASDLATRKVEAVRNYQADPVVVGDAKQLKQVVLNLLLNSLQAVNGHGRVEIRLTQHGYSLEFCLADNGCGIPASDLKRVFEPFFTTKATGTGLGLSVVQGIIVEHRGRITIASELNRGTTVMISLPILP